MTDVVNPNGLDLSDETHPETLLLSISHLHTNPDDGDRMLRAVEKSRKLFFSP